MYVRFVDDNDVSQSSESTKEMCPKRCFDLILCVVLLMEPYKEMKLLLLEEKFTQIVTAELSFTFL